MVQKHYETNQQVRYDAQKIEKTKRNQGNGSLQDRSRYIIVLPPPPLLPLPRHSLLDTMVIINWSGITAYKINSPVDTQHYTAIRKLAVKWQSMGCLLHQIIGVTLRFGEFHDVHTLSSVPVEECPTFEHQGELNGGIDYQVFMH